MTITEFLTARLDEDEARFAVDLTEPAPTDQNAGYIELLHARLTAEVEAKRRIVDIHFGSDGDGGRWWCNACADGAYGDRADWPCPTLRLLALPYADHPDYVEGWRP